jgi:hypothetical protein
MTPPAGAPARHNNRLCYEPNLTINHPLSDMVAFFISQWLDDLMSEGDKTVSILLKLGA